MNYAVEKILSEIDTSKKEKWCGFHALVESEFDIYEFIQQPDPELVTSCYYHSWICTDTQVGIRVWYYADEPVCISFQPYRKSDESFFWLSEEAFNKVRDYAHSLISKYYAFAIENDEIISELVEKFEKIEYKSHETKNVISSSN